MAAQGPHVCRVHLEEGHVSDQYISELEPGLLLGLEPGLEFLVEFQVQHGDALHTAEYLVEVVGVHPELADDDLFAISRDESQGLHVLSLRVQHFRQDSKSLAIGLLPLFEVLSVLVLRQNRDALILLFHL